MLHACIAVLQHICILAGKSQQQADEPVLVVDGVKGRDKVVAAGAGGFIAVNISVQSRHVKVAWVGGSGEFW